MAFPTDSRVVAQLVGFFEQTADLVGVSDESGKVLYVNPAARKRLGVGVDAELTTADLFPPDAFALYYDEIRPRLLNETTWNGLLPVVNESGGSTVTFASVVADVGAGGEILGVVTYARELSHIAPARPRTPPNVEQVRVWAGLAELGDIAGDATRGPDPDHDLVALVFLNLSGIEEVDAAYGSDTGDVVLRALENRMLRVARVYDRVARIERNQYAILFRGIGDTAHGLRIAHLVRDLLLESPVPSIDGDIEVSVDVGVAISGTDAELPDLLRRAEAVRLATRPRNDSASEAVAEAIDSEMLSIGDFRVAQSQGLVMPYVQPVHDLRSGAVIGYQGLARWLHPTLGLLDPEVFIGLMSESSVAPVIDLKVARATSEAVTLTSRDIALRVYTPVSTRMLGDVRAEQHLREIVEAFSLAADRLYVQLSCRLLDPRSATLASMLASMRDSGLRVVLTDVESASDVVAFADCDFDELHVSRQLTRASADGAQHDSLCEAIQYARDLGRTVGAAGIETVVDCDALVDVGCEVGSGSFFGSPVRADSVE